MPDESARSTQRPRGQPPRWADVRALAEEALALPAEARSAFLASACGADAALRAEVEAQLDACAAAASSSFLAEPAAVRAAPLFAQTPAEESTAAAAPPGAQEPREVDAALRAALADRYAVERELVHGAAATVYVARDTRHDRRVALKVLEPALGAALSTERFLREIRVTAALTHPHILPLHDSGEAAGRLYYVMPFVEGETLRERLAREGALPLTDAVRILREVADALAYAHGRGVVHRDIKPANILLHDGHALVADFGIARAFSRAQEAGSEEVATGPAAALGAATLTAVGTSPGTPAYMAPEQASGGTVDERADLYALGVVAYEVLAGTHPFAAVGAHTPQAIIDAHLSANPAPLSARRPHVPPPLAALVNQLLAKDPAKRPASAEAVRRALDAMPAAPVKHAPMRRPLVAAAALVVALGAGGYLVWQRAAAPRNARASTAHEAGRAAGAIRSLAVLPFVNTSRDPQDEYFSDGLTDELAHALAGLPGLRLAGRTSTYALKGKTVAAREVGRTLGVDAFVSATVRRSGDRLRVNPQLVRAADGTVLWDSVYESRSGDVFAVQDSLTRAVVAALAPALGGGNPRVRRTSAALDVGRGTRDPEAYELYLKGRYYWHERGAENVARSIAYFQQAIGRDPTFARAYAGLALAYNVYAVYVPDPTDSTTALLRVSARRALTLDSTLADGHLAIALALAREHRVAEAEAHFQAALRLEPANPYVHHAYGFMLIDFGRTDAALTQLHQATRLDPLALSAHTAVAEALLDAHRFREVEDEARRVLAIEPRFPLALSSLGLAQAFAGQADSGVSTLEHAVSLYPGLYVIQGRLMFAYAAAGRWQDVARMRAQLRRPGGDPTGGALTAFADLVLGDREPLLRLLATPTGRRHWVDMLRPTADGTGCNPLVDPVTADARYRALMRDYTVPSCPQARPWPLPPRPAERPLPAS